MKDHRDDNCECVGALAEENCLAQWGDVCARKIREAPLLLGEEGLYISRGCQRGGGIEGLLILHDLHVPNLL